MTLIGLEEAVHSNPFIFRFLPFLPFCFSLDLYIAMQVIHLFKPLSNTGMLALSVTL
jgi:hypothetical protein